MAVGTAAGEFLDWWADRCRRDCLHDVPEGLFVDQRWVDLAAAYFPPHVLRDPGLNAAYWNLDERPIEPAPGGGHLAGGGPAAVPPLQRLRPRRRPPAHPLPRGTAAGLLSERGRRCSDLCAAYGERLRAEGWDECRKLDYGLAFAANGMVLDGLMRRIFRQELLRRERTHEHDVGGVDDVPDPYEPDEVAAFVEMLRSPFPGSAAPRIPRYLHALHHSRPDLQAPVPDLTGWEGNHYLAWIREIGAEPPGPAARGDPGRGRDRGAVEPPADARRVCSWSGTSPPSWGWASSAGGCWRSCGPPTSPWWRPPRR